MAMEIRVPTLGESISEATVGKWFKTVSSFLLMVICARVPVFLRK